MKVATGSFLSPEKPLMWLHPPCSFVYLCINLAATGVKGKAAPDWQGTCRRPPEGQSFLLRLRLSGQGT